MKELEIAVVDAGLLSGGAWIRSLERDLDKNSIPFEIEGFRNVIPAMEAFASRRYDLIITDLHVAPGFGFEEDPEISRIIADSTEIIPYWKIVCHAISQARTPKSPNRKTPILVATIYHPTDYTLCQDAEIKVREAGATDYLYLVGDSLNIKEFIKRVKSYLPKED